ncbi:helix-turn-helix domain-containing protein [Myxosarcina sp. GI1(2024)]
MPLINQVQRFIDSRGLSVYRFQKQTGVSSTTCYLLYSNQKHLPSAKTLERICDAYQVQPYELIEWVSDRDS